MKITVEKIGAATFEATNEQGASLRMDGPADLGAPGTSLRPMETVLAALAGCSGIDVVKILSQQKEPLSGLSIEVEGTRKDAVPAVFTEIAIKFVIKGPVAENKARRAVALSMEKYCSVTRMLEPTVAIRHEVVLVP